MAASINMYRRGPVFLYQNAHHVLASLLINGNFPPSHCSIHTSHSLLVDRRKDRALIQHLHHRDHEKSIRHRNLLIVDLPDYSYTDGRPTELTICQKKRQERNYELATEIIKLVNEMKFAQEQSISQKNAEAKSQQQRLDSRLKEKEIIKLVNEMKFAQEQSISQKNAEAKSQQQRLDSRLKEKGKDIA